MNASRFGRTLAVLSVLALTCGGSAHGQEPIEPLLDDLFELTDVAQQAHVQPPVRQQMMLAAVRAVADAVDEPLSPDQTQSFSDASADQLRPLVKQMLELDHMVQRLIGDHKIVRPLRAPTIEIR